MKVRKIAALAVGAAMVGATLGYANAALPGKEFFVKDGMPNVKIVVGANAPSTMDVASAADVALAIGSLLYTSEEVEASGVSVVVKRETTQYPDPIPVYSNLYKDTGVDPNTTNEELSDLSDDQFWWNGSAYNGAYSAWDSWTPKFEGEIENMDRINGNAQIDWDFTILDIELVDENQETIAYPPKEATLKIPAGNFTVTLNYVIQKWEKNTTTLSDVWGSLDSTTETDTVVDDDNPGGYTAVDTVYDGVGEGDTFTILGNSYYVLKLNATEESMTFGKDHRETWFQLGDIKDYDGYKVKAVDISVNENRALVEVTSPEGVDQLVILNKNEEKDVFGDGGIILTLTDTFVGIDGNLIATIKVVTNQKTVKTGDELIPGWEVGFEFSADGKIVTVTLTNKNDLEGKELDILGKYKMYYKSEVYTKDVDDDDKEEYAVKSYIVVEPVEKTWEPKELKVGDEFEGWTIEAIKGEAYTKVTPMVPTEPITVLDTEVDVNAVDSNLILVGGPVANAITKYLVDQGLSTVDWENSEGDLEYIEDAFGTYDVLIVAGKDRYATREAAKELMEYLAEL